MSHTASDQVTPRPLPDTDGEAALWMPPDATSRYLRAGEVLEKSIADTPVLVFGTGLTALGVLRSFQKIGVVAYSVCAPNELPAKSRWYRPAPLSSDSIPSPEQLCEYLTASSLDRAVLVPCSDDWVRAIAELPESLKTRFPASISGSLVVRTMTDKGLFAATLQCLEIPRPKTLLLHSFEEMSELGDECYRNMFLKPLDSQEFARRHRAKAFRLKDRAHALEIMQNLRGEGSDGFPILLQEYIPGATHQYYLVDGFVDARGRISALIARRRLSQYPPLFGNSARSETIPLDQVGGAIETLERMWSAVPYRGIFDAEFKYDDRDGQFKILEVNARPWWFIEFATRCGVDLCGMTYRDALGLPVQPVHSYATGRRCVYSSYDLAAHYSTDPGVAGFLRWLRSCHNVEDIIYRWDDPWPGITSTLSSLRTLARRVLQGHLE